MKLYLYKISFTIRFYCCGKFSYSEGRISVLAISEEEARKRFYEDAKIDNTSFGEVKDAIKITKIEVIHQFNEICQKLDTRFTFKMQNILINTMLEAKSKDGHIVYLDYIEDCEDNEGGFFVMVYESDECGDYFDYFCIHTYDCDCTNYDEVEKYAVKYIAIMDYSEYFNKK